VFANILRPSNRKPARQIHVDPKTKLLITWCDSGIGKTTAEVSSSRGKVTTCRRENPGSRSRGWHSKSGARLTCSQTCAIRNRPKLVDAMVAGMVGLTSPSTTCRHRRFGEVQDLAVEDYLTSCLRTRGRGLMKYRSSTCGGTGVIINMASVSGHRGFPILPRTTVRPSKHAVNGDDEARRRGTRSTASGSTPSARRR